MPNTKDNTTMQAIYKLERKNYDTDTMTRKVKDVLYEEEASAYQKAKIAMMILLDATNGGDKSEIHSGLICGILDTHRHLQSVGLNTLLLALGNYGRLDGQSDARNEYVKDTCKSLVTALKERMFWRD
jgi:hypothetical protein